MSSLDKTRIKMNIIANIAEELFNDAKLYHDQIPNPTNWLYNEEKMRNLTRLYNINLVMLNQFSIQSDPILKYNKFMCENYPIGFGSKLKQLCIEKKQFNGAKLYLSMQQSSSI